jgi:hypothetical protein
MLCSKNLSRRNRPQVRRRLAALRHRVANAAAKRIHQVFCRVLWIKRRVQKLAPALVAAISLECLHKSPHRSLEPARATKRRSKRNSNCGEPPGHALCSKRLKKPRTGRGEMTEQRRRPSRQRQRSAPPSTHIYWRFLAFVQSAHAKISRNLLSHHEKELENNPIFLSPLKSAQFIRIGPQHFCCPAQHPGSAGFESLKAQKSGRVPRKRNPCQAQDVSRIPWIAGG